MRRTRFGLVLIAIALAVGVWVARKDEAPRNEATPLKTTGLEERPASILSPRDEAPPNHPARPAAPPQPSASSASSTPAAPDAEALLEIDKVNLMVRDYRSIAGENPVGTNAEIMAAVMGNNPKQAKLGPPENMSLNEKGELIDRWGTPYFFHQLSRDHMEIRSAGPDLVMWTDDDVVMK